jgi:hypothetical protein
MLYIHSMDIVDKVQFKMIRNFVVGKQTQFFIDPESKTEQKF